MLLVHPGKVTKLGSSISPRLVKLRIIAAVPHMTLSTCQENFGYIILYTVVSVTSITPFKVPNLGLIWDSIFQLQEFALLPALHGSKSCFDFQSPRHQVFSKLQRCPLCGALLLVKKGHSSKDRLQVWMPFKGTPHSEIFPNMPRSSQIIFSCFMQRKHAVACSCLVPYSCFLSFLVFGISSGFPFAMSVLHPTKLNVGRQLLQIIGMFLTHLSALIN